MEMVLQGGSPRDVLPGGPAGSQSRDMWRGLGEVAQTVQGAGPAAENPWALSGAGKTPGCQFAGGVAPCTPAPPLRAHLILPGLTPLGQSPRIQIRIWTCNELRVARGEGLGPPGGHHGNREAHLQARPQQGGFRAGGDEIIHVGKCFLSPSPDIFWASVPPYLGKGLGTGAACPGGSQAGPVVPWAPRDMGWWCPACFCPSDGVCGSSWKRLGVWPSCPHPCPPTVAWERGVLCGKGRALGLEIAKCGQK